MAVEFCIWLWRMYRFKQKQERLQLRQAKLQTQLPSGVARQSHTVKDAQPAQ